METWAEEPGRSGAVQFRCPTCKKLYAADPADLHSPGTDPTDPAFSCPACGSDFSLRIPTAIRPDRVAESGEGGLLSAQTRVRMKAMQGELALRPGEALPLKSTSASWPPCVRCLRRNPPGVEECAGCGVVFKKVRLPEELLSERDVRAGGTVEVARLWDDALLEWESDERHSAFVEGCFKQGRLPFASYKYGLIFSQNPEDGIVKAMRRRIVLMASTGATPARSDRRRLGSGSRILTATAIALAAAVFTAGVALPGMRNMAGVGASLLALTVGLRFWLQGTVDSSGR